MKPEHHYRYGNAEASHTAAYIWQAALSELKNLARLPSRAGEPFRVLDLGCGNGAFTATLAECGFQVVGVEPSVEGIAQARLAHPELQFEQGSAYDDLNGRFGLFDAVTSLEVVEHVMWPRRYADCIFDCLKPGGTALVSTPYHGYWKNVALALSGKMDQHFTALWDGGHIKFWSENTLSTLMLERGFRTVNFRRLGRVPILAKSMLAICQK